MRTIRELTHAVMELVQAIAELDLRMYGVQQELNHLKDVLKEDEEDE